MFVAFVPSAAVARFVSTSTADAMSEATAAVARASVKYLNPASSVRSAVVKEPIRSVAVIFFNDDVPLV